MDDGTADERVIGVGPHARPWPEDDRYDPELLEHGDRRNVADRFRYWRREAIVAELDRSRHAFHVAIENVEDDRNIGSIVRTANAMGAGAFHIMGRRRWNRRGAMVTDRYQHEHHHADMAALAAWAREHGYALFAIDNVTGAEPLEAARLPERCVLVLGQEGPGLSADALAVCERVLAITQYGSTRSMNVAAAGAIAMHAWVLEHAWGRGPIRQGAVSGSPERPGADRPVP
ncbi:TrmH family RNA methyltransferase [Brachybacterium nesterenkovii]|nr:TrmH family RNA methyltransferase [Brachybacterium nesterenkovii]